MKQHIYEKIVIPFGLVIIILIVLSLCNVICCERTISEISMSISVFSFAMSVIACLYSNFYSEKILSNSQKPYLYIDFADFCYNKYIIKQDFICIALNGKPTQDLDRFIIYCHNVADINIKNFAACFLDTPQEISFENKKNTENNNVKQDIIYDNNTKFSIQFNENCDDSCKIRRLCMLFQDMYGDIYIGLLEITINNRNSQCKYLDVGSGVYKKYAKLNPQIKDEIDEAKRIYLKKIEIV